MEAAAGRTCQRRSRVERVEAALRRRQDGSERSGPAALRLLLFAFPPLLRCLPLPPLLPLLLLLSLWLSLSLPLPLPLSVFLPPFLLVPLILLLLVLPFVILLVPLPPLLLLLPPVSLSLAGIPEPLLRTGACAGGTAGGTGNPAVGRWASAPSRPA